MTSVALPPCPSWCSSAPGHPYTDEAADASYVARYHEDALDLGSVVPSLPSASFSGLGEHAVTVGISAEEQAVTDAGPAVQSAPRLTLWTENPSLTAAEARAVAALLNQAAARLDHLIEGQQ